MQLDEYPDPRHRLLVAAQPVGIDPCRIHRRGKAHTVCVAQPPRGVRVGSRRSAAGCPMQATPNRAPSSSTQLTTAAGRSGLQPLPAEFLDRQETRYNAQRPVEGAAVRDAVQVAAGDHRIGSGSAHHAHWLPLRSVS